MLGSAVVGGGYGSAREILNVHVDDKYDGERPEEDLAAVAAELGVARPFVGLMTAAYTEFARCAVESLGDLTRRRGRLGGSQQHLVGGRDAADRAARRAAPRRRARAPST